MGFSFLHQAQIKKSQANRIRAREGVALEVCEQVRATTRSKLFYRSRDGTFHEEGDGVHAPASLVRIYF